MADPSATRDLFARWERVWHERQNDLVSSCVADTYIRHDENGDRTVTRDEYAAELRQVHQGRPDIRVLIYDHTLTSDRAWFRFAFKWTDLSSGQQQSRAGMQAYRIEGGKLAETWIAMKPLGSTWDDKPQDSWTSPKC